MDDLQNNSSASPKINQVSLIVWVPILLGIFVLGAYFRFVGLNWDESQHLHPDERFLTMVESALTPVKSLDDFFNTSKSTLNPQNVGYGFFVYGTLPIFMVRYAAEWLDKAAYDEVFLLGRSFSGALDLLTVLFVFLIAERLFRKRWKPRALRGLSLLAAAFYACAVLPIQLSHFFAVDTFTNAFSLLAIYFAVVIMTDGPAPIHKLLCASPSVIFTRRWLSVLPYLGFGIAYGMALASKVSILPLAAILPFAA
ncbi:MAG: hypothetical protein Q7U74_15370, partial [Saprospiraceae bacterium]|nr:hypothetical protein [Saprospiraceae bacterium]